MLRRALLTLCIMCGLTAAALWWVSRNGEKIIYLDARLVAARANAQVS